MSAQIDGQVSIRPVRLGLVFRPSPPSLIRAAESAAIAWGGKFYVFLAPEPEMESLALARSAGVDALWSIDQDPASEHLCRTDGYKWWGATNPFENAGSLFDATIADPSWLFDLDGTAPLLPDWHETDPLHLLYTVWFGKYPESDLGNMLKAKAEARGDRLDLAIDGTIPFVAERPTCLDLTAVHVDNELLTERVGIAVLDPSDPSDLAQFWNLRALGAAVFPWPIGFEARVRPALTSWINARIAAGEIVKRHSGTDDLTMFLDIWLPERLDAAPPALVTALKDHAIVAYPSRFERPRYWHRDHPLDSKMSRSFSSFVSDNNARSFTVPLPQLNALPRRRTTPVGVVTAHVSISRGSNLGPYRTASVPNVRQLAPLLQTYENLVEPFHYPTHSGQAIGVSLDAENVAMPILSNLEVITSLLNGAGWICKQTDEGRFATQLIELLGGSGTGVANQPAVRAVLQKAARAHQGLPYPALVQEAASAQGDWPPPLMRVDRGRYPAAVVNHLLEHRLLQPVLPVKCTSCATTSALRPEDLATDVSCPMCSARFPLGLAISTAKRRSEWHYQLAGNVPAQRVSEVMPVMAALSLMSSVARDSALAHVLGLKVSGSGINCEIDLAVAMNDNGPGVVIVGEVKSYKTPVDAHDLANLRLAQQHLRDKGVDCYVLAATLRDRLLDEELLALRQFAESTISSTRGDSMTPLLPIVFTKDDLSAPPHSDKHPGSWERFRGLSDLARISCERNLGLIDYRYQSNGPSEWTLRWDRAVPNATAPQQ